MKIDVLTLYTEIYDVFKSGIIGVLTRRYLSLMSIT